MLIIAGFCDGDGMTRNTVRVALFWYSATCFAVLTKSSQFIRYDLLSFRVIRWYWTIGCCFYLIHVGVAFHHFHHWSHNAAVAFTERNSGVGNGIFASYLFSMVWFLDVLAAWRYPKSYWFRSRWLQLEIHGFILFMVVNGAIVFASGPTRWISLSILVGLVLTWWIRFGRSSPDTRIATKTINKLGW